MKVERVFITHAESAQGIVVVIDVIRAFSVAAYALDRGAERLLLVQTVEEAFSLRDVFPKALLAGEVGGRMIDGFDHNNSPARMARAEVRGKTIIQRTGAGTQGATRATNASALLLCSLVNARATARYARLRAEQEGLPVALLPTYRWNEQEMVEDDICADYLEALLHGHADARSVLESSLDALKASQRLDPFSTEDPDFPLDDIAHCFDVDRFSFAMEGTPASKSGVRYVEVWRRDLPAHEGSPSQRQCREGLSSGGMAN